MEKKITYIQCPACHSAAISLAIECKDFTVSQQVFSIWKCSTCTLRFTQHVPDATDIAPYYNSDAYVSHSNTKKGLINRLYHVVRSYTLKKKRSLIKNVTLATNGSLLDVGAGTGAFAGLMQQSGWQVTGLEPDETARANALQNHQLQLKPSEWLYKLQPITFDAITMWHVLEHVHDLHQYLETFHKILKPEGKLVIAVPNYCSYDAYYYKECWAAYDVPRHLYHFSPRSMELLAEAKGFKINKLKPMWFDSFYVSMLSEKYRFGKENSIKGAYVGLVSNLKALSDTRKCSSVIYVLSKK